MNKRRLIILSFSLICLVLIIGGFLYRYSEQLAEEKLQDYVKRLKDASFTVEEHSLADFHVDGVVRIHFFGDFRSFAEQETVSPIYFDKGIRALFFLRPIGDRIEANVFYYK